MQAACHLGGSWLSAVYLVSLTWESHSCCCGEGARLTGSPLPADSGSPGGQLLLGTPRKDPAQVPQLPLDLHTPPPPLCLALQTTRERDWERLLPAPCPVACGHLAPVLGCGQSVSRALVPYAAWFADGMGGGGGPAREGTRCLVSAGAWMSPSYSPSPHAGPRGATENWPLPVPLRHGDHSTVSTPW